MVDLSVPATTPGQFALAVGLLALGLVVVALLSLSLRTVELTDREKRVAQAVQRGLARRTPGTVRIPADELPARDRIAEAFETGGAVDDPTTIRQASKSVYRALGMTIAPFVERVSPFARRLFLLAGIVSFSGALAVSHETIARGLRGGGSLNPGLWPQLAIQDSVAALQQAIALLTGIPGVDLSWSLALTLVLTLGEYLYQRWWLAAFLLAAIALRLYLWDRAGVDRVAFDLPTPTGLSYRIVAGIGGGWLVTLVAMGIVRKVSTVEAARDLGTLVLIVAVVGAMLTTLFMIRSVVQRLRRSYRVACYFGLRARLIVHLVGLLLALVVAPLVPVWMLVGLTNVGPLVGAWLQASLAIQLVTLLVGLVPVLALVLAARSAGSDVAAALSETVRRRSVQAAVVGRALPFGLVFFAYLLALGAGMPAVPAAAAGLLTGLLAHGLWRAYLRLRDRLPERERDESREDVVIHAYTIPTPAGDQYLARVNGTLVAGEDRAAAIDAVVERAREETADRRPRPTVGEFFAERLREMGWTDRDVILNGVREDCRRAIEGRVHSESGLEDDDLRAALRDRFPKTVWTDELEWARASPRCPVEYQGGRYLPA